MESARAANEQAAATYRQTVLTALQEVEDNLTAATALAQEQQLQTEALAAAQRALEVVSNQYRAGTVGISMSSPRRPRCCQPSAA